MVYFVRLKSKNMNYKPTNREYHFVNSKDDSNTVVIFLRHITHISTGTEDKTCVIHLTSGESVIIEHDYQDFLRQTTAPLNP